MRCPVVAVLLLWPLAAQADGMDLELSGLRVAAGETGCPFAGADFCPDHEAFERLASELGTSLATPVNGPARSLGARGLYFGVDTTATTLDGEADYWQLGTEGSSGTGEGRNTDTAGALTLSRMEVRKGLPASLEVGGSIGHAPGTSLWAVGASLRLSPLEGFVRGWGAIPDLSLRGAVMTVVGSSQISARIYSLDVVLSKPIVIDSSWVVSPFGGAQLLLTEFDSAQVDFTPEVADDPDNIGVFDPVRQFRWRAVLGAQARVDWVTLALSAMVDLSAPTLDAEISAGSEPEALQQLALNLSLGATL